MSSWDVLTCDGDCLDVSRSCCNVRSTVLCFWKLCRAFDGPHMLSAIVNSLYLVLLKGGLGIRKTPLVRR